MKEGHRRDGALDEWGDRGGEGGGGGATGGGGKRGRKVEGRGGGEEGVGVGSAESASVPVQKGQASEGFMVSIG